MKSKDIEVSERNFQSWMSTQRRHRIFIWKKCTTNTHARTAGTSRVESTCLTVVTLYSIGAVLYLHCLRSIRKVLGWDIVVQLLCSRGLTIATVSLPAAMLAHLLRVLHADAWHPPHQCSEAIWSRDVLLKGLIKQPVEYKLYSLVHNVSIGHVMLPCLTSWPLVQTSHHSSDRILRPVATTPFRGRSSLFLLSLVQNNLIRELLATKGSTTFKRSLKASILNQCNILTT